MDDGVSELAKSLAVEEFKALRAESSAAKGNQQTIIQWTLAATGIALAGSITATRPVVNPDQSRTYLAIILVYGTVIPIFIGCAFAIWVGEIRRMERAGRFLRLRERQVWPPLGQHPDLSDDSVQRRLPIMWENLIYDSSPVNQSAYGKNEFGSAAAVLLFATLYGFSCMLSVVITFAAPNPIADSLPAQVGVLVWNILLVLGACILFGKSLVQCHVA